MRHTRQKQHIVTREQVYLLCTLGFFCTIFSAYVYFVSASIVHVVIRKESGKEMALLHSEISRLETQYINQQHSMSEEVASLQGFVTTHDKIFIDRSTDSLVLSTDTLR